jgi:uncharacterized OB-fold protein
MKNMIGTKCIGCEKIYFPKRTCCPNCNKKDMEEVLLGNTLTLLTYTELWTVPKGIDQLPLLLGILEFENGTKVLGQLESKDVKIGLKFKPVWSKIRKINGKEIYGFKFESTHP